MTSVVGRSEDGDVPVPEPAGDRGAGAGVAGGASPFDADAATRTSTGAVEPPPQQDSPANHRGETPAQRLPAPLQYRDPARYDILGEHGRGGLGRVYRARDLEMGRDVAVKELLSRGAASELRFFREALITARLEHPGIVPVHEAGRWPDGTPFYAMKLVAGRPLKVVLEGCQTLEQRLALLPHVIAVADAIAYAHDRKIIHRDLKPGNVIVGEFGETVVIDWGLAKDLSPDAAAEEPTEAGPYRTAAAAPGVTVAGSVLGTPAYMAPEQARGEDVDERADVFAIGAMLYQLCTGEHTPPTNAFVLRQALRRTGVDVDLTAIVAKACAPEPRGRYRDAGKLVADLRAFANGARVLARHYSAGALVRHWVKRHKRAAVAAAAMVVTVAVVGVVAFVRVQEERDLARRARDSAIIARESERSSRTAAEVARDRAILSEAAMLRETDPTRALERLNQAPTTHPSLAPERALLQSRTIGSGTATALFSVAPALVRDISISTDWKQVALVTTTRKLHLVTLKQPRGEVIAERLLDPSPVVNTGGDWRYFDTTSNSPALATAGSPTRIPLTALHGRPVQAVASAEATYVLDEGNTVHSLAPKGSMIVAGNVGKMVAWDSRVALFCSLDGTLYSMPERKRPLGACAPAGGPYSIAASGDSYAAVADAHHVLVTTGKAARYVSADIGMQAQVAISREGLVAAISEDGRTWYVLPGAPAASPGPPATGQATYTAVDAMTIAWGYADGSVRVFDARSGGQWTFFGHQGPVSRLAVNDKTRSVISAGGSDMRLWHLEESLVERRTPLPCTPFNVEPNSTGDVVAVDCHDGPVFLVRPFASQGAVLHRHHSLSFSPAWLGANVCSGGWDGQVLCSDTASNKTQIVAAYSKPVRWVESSPARDKIAYAVDDGSIWLYDGNTVRRLYTHKEEPYRIAFKKDGLQLASGDQGGELVVIDLQTNRVRRDHTHQGLIFGLDWADDGLRTASFDGTLRRWSSDLSLLATESFADPLREMAVTRDSLIVSLGRVVKVVHGSSQYNLDLGERIADLDVSADGQYAALAIASEVVVFRLHDLAISSVTRFKTDIACARFVRRDVLALCAPDGLLWLRTTSLDFVLLPK